MQDVVEVEVEVKVKVKVVFWKRIWPGVDMEGLVPETEMERERQVPGSPARHCMA